MKTPPKRRLIHFRIGDSAGLADYMETVATNCANYAWDVENVILMLSARGSKRRAKEILRRVRALLRHDAFLARRNAGACRRRLAAPSSRGKMKAGRIRLKPVATEGGR